jgi:peptidoglycan/LPS O-acetylase OafA/YrhL
MMAFSTFIFVGFFRIAPLYYFAILFYWLVGHWGHWPLESYLFNILFIHGLVPSANNGIVPGGWSIGTEMLFYLVFPLIFIFYNRIGNRKLYFSIPLIGVLITSLCVYSFRLNQSHLAQFWYYNIINQLPIFLLGSSLFFSRINVPNKYSLLAWILLSSLAIILPKFLKNDITFCNFLAGLSFVFLFMLFKNIRALNHYIISRIGQLSFSIYIFHFVFLSLVASFINPIFTSPRVAFIVCSILVLLLTVAVAYLSELYIEKPGRNLGKSIITRIKQSRASLIRV